MIKKLLLAAGLGLLFTWGQAMAAGAAPNSRPASKPASKSATKPFKTPWPAAGTPLLTNVFPLAAAEKMPIREYTLRELQAKWPAFRHEPFNKSGVNPLSLPFRYKSLDGEGKPQEAYALSFLLSHTLDWLPGNYCSRHAYFVFKREETPMKKLAQQYDPKLIAKLIAGWDATCAVGGEITFSNKGYSGILEVYDRAGKLAMVRKYDQPREFFDLLGDMCSDFSAYAGYKPTKAMNEEFRRARCKKESLAKLGSAAFAAERSNEEFAIYDGIVKDDPDFAEVAYWWANQKFWRDRDAKDYSRRKAALLEKNLCLAALSDLEFDQCPPELADKWEGWVKSAEELVGQDHPDLLRLRLAKYNNARQQVPLELREKATEAAQKYPNSYWMMHQLGMSYWTSPNAPDADLSAGIHLAAANCLFLTSLGDHNDNRWGYTDPVKGMYPELVVSEFVSLRKAMAEKPGGKTDTWSAMSLARSYAAMGRYAESIVALREAYHDLDAGASAQTRTDVLAEAFITAVMSGDEKTYKQIERDHPQELKDCANPDLLEAYLSAARGQCPDMSTIGKKSLEGHAFWHGAEDLLRNQVEIMLGRADRRVDVDRWMCVEPDYRPLWILADAYDRVKPSDELASMYEALEWLHGEDPWVKKAAGEFRIRHPNARPADGRRLLEKLQDYSPERWPERRPDPKGERYEFLAGGEPPGAYAAGVRGLLKEMEFDKAMELALRYHHLAVDSGRWTAELQACHMIHLVEQAKAAAPPKQDF